MIHTDHQLDRRKIGHVCEGFLDCFNWSEKTPLKADSTELASGTEEKGESELRTSRHPLSILAVGTMWLAVARFCCRDLRRMVNCPLKLGANRNPFLLKFRLSSVFQHTKKSNSNHSRNNLK